MSNGSIGMLLAWCPGKNAPCDPCKPTTGNLELFGNIDAQYSAAGFAGGSITHWPEFPLSVSIVISYQGSVAHPGGGGSTGFSGSSTGPSEITPGPGLGVVGPLPPTFFQAPLNWNPNGSDLLVFNVHGSSSTTSAAWLSTGSVSLKYHPQSGGAYLLLYKIKWTGDAA